MAASDSSRLGPNGDVFWNWRDALVFLGLLAPSALLAFGLAQLVWLMIGKVRLGAYLITFQFIGYGIWLTTLYLLLHARYERPFWRSMGWRIPYRGMFLTLFGGPLLAIVVALLAAALRTPTGSTLTELMRDHVSMALIGIFSFTLGPMVEELVFRGFFQPLLIRSLGAPLGILMCAVPFAVLHGPQYHWAWQIVLLLVLAGVVFGYVRLRTGSTAASTVVHAGYNLTFFLGYLLQRKELPF